VGGALGVHDGLAVVEYFGLIAREDDVTSMVCQESDGKKGVILQMGKNVSSFCSGGQ
jgi:hypothetical protein